MENIKWIDYSNCKLYGEYYVQNVFIFKILKVYLIKQLDVWSLQILWSTCTYLFYN